MNDNFNNKENERYNNPYQQQNNNQYNQNNFNGYNQYQQQGFNGYNQYQQPQNFNGYNQYQQPMNYYRTPEEDNARNLAIISLVLSIVSFFVSVPVFSIAGIIIGVISRKKKPQNNGMATAGIVLSIISIVLFVIVVILACIFILPDIINGAVEVHNHVESGLYSSGYPNV